MKIKELNDIPASDLIPRHHWKWLPKRKKKGPEILNGDLVLYDRYGELVVHKGDSNGTTKEA